jgi:hypothetical protein
MASCRPRNRCKTTTQRSASLAQLRPGLVSVETLSRQIAEQKLTRFAHVEAIAGREYVSRAAEAFSHYGITVADPMIGLKIGERLYWLTET